MSNFEWFLLVGVVIVVPLVVAIVVTLWTLEMARQRKRSNRPGAAATIGVKRNATKARTETDEAAAENAVDTSVGFPDDRGASSEEAASVAKASNDVRPDAIGPDVGGVRDSGSTV